VWSAFLWAPAVWTLAWSVATGLGGLFAGGIVFQVLHNRRVRQWTRDFVIPEGEKAGIDLERLREVLADLPPPSHYNQDDLSRLRHDAAPIVEELTAFKGQDGDPDRLASKF
jgi:hypothetical protein